MKNEFGATDILQGLYFGAILFYRSPIDGHKTPCVFIRDDGGRAVIFFSARGMGGKSKLCVPVRSAIGFLDQT